MNSLFSVDDHCETENGPELADVLFSASSESSNDKCQFNPRSSLDISNDILLYLSPENIVEIKDQYTEIDSIPVALTFEDMPFQSDDDDLIVLDPTMLNSIFCSDNEDYTDFDGFSDVSNDSFEGFDCSIKKESTFPIEASVCKTSELEPFEGFEGIDNKETSVNSMKMKNVKNDSVPSKIEDQGNKKSSLSDDSFGNYSYSIGCSITWLESGDAMKPPVTICNGIVYELSEFSKKIAWEPIYVAKWILRLRGYKEEMPTDEDQKKIHFLLKRRKAISVTFAGSPKLKQKLHAFDTGCFSLPTAEKLDNIPDQSHDINQTNVTETFANDEQKKCLSPIVSPPKLASTVCSKQRRKTSKSPITSVIKDFPSDKVFIGNHCQGSGIDVHLLNSGKPAEGIITNGVIYELYHYFRERGATLTSLVHALYILKGKKVDKTRVISTMAKIHELVKLLWDTSLSKNPDMPYMEFNIPMPRQVKDSNLYVPLPYDPVKASKILSPGFDTYSTEEIATTSKMNVPHDNFVEENVRSREYLQRSTKCSTKIDSLSSNEGETNDDTESSKSISSDQLCASSSSQKDSKNESLSADSMKEHSSSDEASNHQEKNFSNKEGEEHKEFDLNATKGSKGEITKGDIVFLYSRWLKEKINNKATVFVTDLSADVKDLITERDVDNMRVPCGSLMSSSILLFKHFQELSQDNFKAAKEYLLQDWCEYIRGFLSMKHPKRKLSEDESVSSSPHNSISMHSDSDSLKRKRPSTHSRAVNKNIKQNGSSTVKPVKNDPFVALNLPCDYMSSDNEFSCSSPGKELYPSMSTYKRKNISCQQARALMLAEEAMRITQGNISNKRSIKSPLKYNLNPIENNRSRSPSLERTSEHEDITFGEQYEQSEPLSDTSNNVSPKKYNKLDIEDCEVEKIVGYRIVKIENESATEYKVRWLGFSQEEDSWVEENDLNCPELLKNFWEALKKQKLKQNRKSELLNSASVNRHGKKLLNKSSTFSFQQENVPPIVASMPMKVENEDELESFFGTDSTAQHQFFNMFKDGLHLAMVNYQSGELQTDIRKRKVRKREVLDIYDSWRQENVQNLLAGGNQTADVDKLIAEVKKLMVSRMVRNFSGDTVLDVCYRMALTRSKLASSPDLEEYLDGDFLQLEKSSSRHQNVLRAEHDTNQRTKQRENVDLFEFPDPGNSFNEKVDVVTKLEKEILSLAELIDQCHDNKAHLIDEIEMLQFQQSSSDSVELLNFNSKSAKDKKEAFIKQLKSLGLSEDQVLDIIKYALKMKIS